MIGSLKNIYYFQITFLIVFSDSISSIIETIFKNESSMFILFLEDTSKKGIPKWFATYKNIQSLLILAIKI